MEANFRTIQDMGFSPAEAQEALTQARGDLGLALDWLLTHCPQGIVGVSDPSTAPKQQPAKDGSGASDSPNFVPPPPIDASDHESAQHLEALKRNPPNNEHQTGFSPSNQISPNSQPEQRAVPQLQVPVPTPAGAPSNSATSPQSSPSIVLSANTQLAPPLMENAPMVQVCYRSDSDKPTLDERDRLVALLRSNHIPCGILDIAEDRVMEETIVSAYRKLVLPQAVLFYQPLGDLQTFSRDVVAMRRFIAKKIAEGLQSEHSSTIDEYARAPVSTGAVDGVMNLLTSAVSAVWSSATSATSSTRPSNSFIEFTVIKTNWFYRDQRRIIRFGTNGDFHRIDPNTHDLRETVSYKSIASVVVSPTKITLTLKDNSIHCFNAPPRVIDYMFQLFVAYAPEDTALKYELV